MNRFVIESEGLEESSEPILMTQLEKLKIGLRSWRLIEIISAPKLKGFKSLSLDSFSSEKICHTFKTLRLMTYYRGNIEEFCYHCTMNEEPRATLRLERFDLKSEFKIKNGEYFEMLHSFLRIQAGSVSTFVCKSMRGHYNLRGFYKIIFTELKALTTLAIDFSLLPVEDEFYKQLQPMRSLKDVNVEGSFNNIASAKRFFMLCPNLTCLLALNDHVIPKMLNFLSITNPEIERMALLKICEENIPKLPSLKRLDVMFDGDGYEEFQDINSHVKLCLVPWTVR